MRRAKLAGSLVVIALVGAGCVTVAEHRKLEDQVASQRQSSRRSAQQATADLRAEFRALQERLSIIEGRIEANEHATQEALKEAQQARHEAAQAPVLAGPEPPRPELPARGAAPSGTPAGPPVDRRGGPAPGASTSQGEVGAYREARNAWRAGGWQDCIDRFRTFLQTYPASSYADDAAFWLADCHFKQGDYKTAILRFDDVVARYPDGERSADALYRQGESLLRLGPGYSKAASRAFERVLREYPESPRAPEAKRQLDLLKPH